MLKTLFALGSFVLSSPLAFAHHEVSIDTGTGLTIALSFAVLAAALLLVGRFARAKAKV